MVLTSYCPKKGKDCKGFYFYPLFSFSMKLTLQNQWSTSAHQLICMASKTHQ
jgi:hypothetical protein